MELVDQPLADARGRSSTKDNMALLADKLFDDVPRIKHLLAEVLQQQEDEIHRLQCISQQRQRDIQRQEEEIHKLRVELDTFREEAALERAYDRQRISKLEAPAPALSQKTASDHLDRLFSEMKRLRMRQTTTKDAARLLGVTKRHINRLEPLLDDDHRFQVIKDPRHKQRHLIRLV